MNLERHKAALYLEQLQRKVYQNIGASSPVSQLAREETRNLNEEVILRIYKQRKLYYENKNIETFEEFRQKMIEDQHRAIEITPTVYEEPAWYALLSEMSEEIETVLRSREVVGFQSPLFGTLPTGRVNGMAIAVPGSSYRIILFENGLFGFANLMCKAVSRAFPLVKSDAKGFYFSVEGEDWKNELDANPQICQRFLDVLLAYIVGGNPCLTDKSIRG